MDIFFNNPRGKLFLVVMFGLSMIIAGVISYSMSRLHQKSIESNLLKAQMYSKTFQDHFTQNIKSIDILLENIAISATQEQDEIQSIFEKLLINSPYLRSISLLDEHGVIIKSSNSDNINRVVNLDGFFPKPFASNSILRFSDIYFGRDFHSMVVAREEEFSNYNGLSFFAISKNFQIDNSSFSLLVALNPNFYINYYSNFLDIDSSCVILHRYDGRVATSTCSFIPGEVYMDGLVAKKAKERISDAFVDMEDKFLSYHASEIFPFSIVVSLDYEKNMKNWRAERDLVLSLSIFLVVLIFVLGGYLFFKLESRKREREEERIEAFLMMKKRVEEAVKVTREQDIVIFEQKREQSLSNLLINIAHQWRQPLNNIGMLIQVIEDDLSENSVDIESVKKRVQIAMDELTSLSSTISFFTELRLRNASASYVDLKDTLESIIVILEHELKSLNIETVLRIEDNCKIFAFKNEIVEIFIQLIENVIEIVKKRKLEECHIEISCKKDENEYKIEIEDSAGGIDEEIIKNIFDPYSTLSFKSRDKGLGMYQIKRVIKDRYDGDIFVRNSQRGAVIDMVLKNYNSSFKSPAS